MSRRHEHVALVLLAALALASFVFVARRCPPADDYYTFLRYADNALAGHGLTFNTTGEKVEGYTSFPYLMLLLVLRSVGLDPELCGRLSCGALFAVLPFLGWRLTRASGLAGERSLVVPVLLATSPALCLHACSAMESMLLVALVVFALTLFLQRHFLACGFVLGAVVLVRPEGIVVALVLVSAAIMERAATLRLLAGGAIVLPHLLWRRWYYGAWLPNSFYAKTGGPWASRIAEGAVGLHRLLATVPGALVVLSLVAWLLAPRSRIGSLLAVLTGAACLVLLLEGVDDWLHWWHASTASALATLLLGHSVVADRLSTTRRDRIAAWIVCAAYVTFLVAGLVRHPESERVVVLVFAVVLVALLHARRHRASLAVVVALSLVALRSDGREFHDFTPTAAALQAVTTSNDTLATGAAGAIPYFTRLVTYDTLGVNDVHIAHEPLGALDHGGFGHHRGDGVYILSKKPSVLLACYELTKEPEPSLGYEKTFAEISGLAEFEQRYEFHADRTSDGRYLNYYRRKGE